MIISKIKPDNFRNLPDSDIQFSSGLNVIKGPNEAGKSSLLNAIKLSLFGDAASTSAEVQTHKRWGSDKSFSIEIHLDENGQPFIVSRDYENKRNTIILPDGTSFKDKKRIQERITSLVGLPSEKCFISTVCINQDEIRKIDAGIPEVKTLLEEKISGGDIDPNQILKSLNKENVELKRAGLRNPGFIKQTETRLSELTGQLENTKGTVKKTESFKTELSKVLEDLQRLSKELDLKEKTVKNAKKYVDVKKQYDEFSKKYDALDKVIERRRTNSQGLEKVSKEFDGVAGDLKTKEERLREAEQALELMSKKETCEKEIKSISSDVTRLVSLEKELGEINQKLSQIPDIDKKDYTNALKLPGEIDGLARVLAAQEVIVHITPKKKLGIIYKTDESEDIKKDLEKSEKLTISGKGQIVLQIEDVADIDVIQTGEKMRAVVDEHRRKKEVFSYLLRKYKVTSVDSLRDVWEEKQELLKQKSSKEIEYKAILNNRNRDDIDNKKKQHEEKLKTLTEELEKVKKPLPTQDEIDSLKKEVTSLRKKFSELEKAKHLHMGALKDLEEEGELKAEQRGIAKDMAVAKAALDELEMFKCSGEDFLKNEADFKELQKKVNSLNARKEFLEMNILENENVGIEDIANLEEEISLLDEEQYRLNKKVEVNDIISDVLREARVQTVKDISDDLCRKAQENLLCLTSGKYQQIKLGDYLDISLWSDQKKGWIDSSGFNSELSSGLFDQIYFAIRIALVDVLSSQRKMPIFMDDPFVHFDPDRQKKALELCKLLSKKHQILIFTCHDCCDGFADEAIDLSKIKF